MRAVTVSSLLTRRATTGVTAVPPAEPASAAVSQHRSLRALIVTSAPPERITPSSISARVCVGTRMLRAIEAPTPTSPPSALAAALAVSFPLWVAVRLMSPLPASMLVVLPSTTARVWTSTMLMARAPATPTSEAPAPDLAEASVVWTPSEGVPRMVALSDRPSLSTIEPDPMVASSVICTKLTATAAPIPVELLVAEPLATALASVSLWAMSWRGPPALTVRPGKTRASTLVMAMLKEIAAATETELPPFSDVAAFLVCV